MPSPQPEKAVKADGNYSIFHSDKLFQAPVEPLTVEELREAFARPRAVSRRRYGYWTPARLEKLKELRAQGLSWRKIGKRLGLSHAGAYWAYLNHVLGREVRTVVRAGTQRTARRRAPAPAKHYLWCPEEDSILLEGARRYSNRELAKLLGRTPGGVAGRLHRLRTRKVRMKKGPIRLKKVLEEAGISQRKAAELYDTPGLSTASLNAILNWNRWPKIRGLKQKIVNAHRKVGLPAEGLFEPLGPDDTQEEHEMLTKVYLPPQALKHFGLHKDPFASEPGKRSEVFADRPFKDAVAKVVEAARSQRMLALCADVGTGKSTLYAYAREELSAAGVTVIEPSYFAMEALHAGGVVECILRAFEQRPRATLVARRLQVEDVLRIEAEASRPVALVFDEAHKLSDNTFSSLKLFWELREGFARFLSLILIGQKRLEFRLRMNADFRELGERCQIEVLPTLAGRLEDYLKFKLRLAGGQLSELITHHAIEAIAARADTPQIANNLAARVLEAAWKLGEKLPIRKEVVEAALRTSAPPAQGPRPKLETIPGGKKE